MFALDDDALQPTHAGNVLTDIFMYDLGVALELMCHVNRVTSMTLCRTVVTLTSVRHGGAVPPPPPSDRCCFVILALKDCKST